MDVVSDSRSLRCVRGISGSLVSLSSAVGPAMSRFEPLGRPWHALFLGKPTGYNTHRIHVCYIW